MRSRVEIVMIRAFEAQCGDVVNKRGPEKSGWIEIAKVEELQNGSFVLHDDSGTESFTAKGYDLIWLQVLHELHHNSHLAMPE